MAVNLGGNSKRSPKEINVQSIMLFYPAKTEAGKRLWFGKAYVSDDFENKTVKYYSEKELMVHKIKGTEINIKDASSKSYIKNGFIRAASPVLCLSVIGFVIYTISNLLV